MRRRERSLIIGRLTAIAVFSIYSHAFAQGNIDKPDKCSINNTGGNISNSNVYCYPQEKSSKDEAGDKSSDQRESFEQKEWVKEGFNKRTISTIPVYIYPGVQHDRDGQIAEELKKLLSSKLRFSDKYHAALYFRIVNANVYYIPPSDAEADPIGYAGFRVDLQWAGGASLPPIVVGTQTSSIAGNMPRNEALQVNAMSLAVSQACKKIISMAGDDPKDC